MSKICAKCEKSVYPLEELKCLDKVWHKACFRCAECGMLLNMKNYKGYAKVPYCVAHYPQAKATVVAETPEMARLAQNTKFQSQVKYHEDFEKNIKGSKIEVTDDPETQRVMKVNALISQLEYKGKKEHSKSSPAPPLANKPKIMNKLAAEKTSNGDKFSPFSSRCVTNSTVYSSDGSKVQAKKQPVKRIGSIADYDPVNENYGSLASGYKPASRQSSQVQDVVGGDDVAFVQPVKLDIGDQEINHTVPNDKPEKAETVKKAEEAEDVEEEEERKNVDEKMQEVVDVVVAEESREEDEEDIKQLTDVEEKPQNVSTLVKPDIVGIADSLTDQVIGSIEGGFKEQSSAEKESTNEDAEFEEVGASEVATHLRPDVVPEEEGGHEPASSQEIVGVDDGEGGEIITTPLPGLFVAMFDYDAQDEDEVSFVEDDTIEDVEKIDEGWLLGTVTRTGLRGMLPANYVALQGAEEQEE